MYNIFDTSIQDFNDTFYMIYMPTTNFRQNKPWFNYKTVKVTTVVTIKYIQSSYHIIHYYDFYYQTTKPHSSSM